jgi:dihydrofolate reductase
MKALARGGAEPYQQQMALGWILYMLGTRAPVLVPGDQYMQSAAAGKQWGGLQILKLIETVQATKKAESEHGI